MAEVFAPVCDCAGSAVALDQGTAPLVSVSVVSHGQAALVQALLNDLQQYAGNVALEVLLTVNIPESLPVGLAQLPFPVRLIHNTKPLGFGQNHNRAFAQASGVYFCVVNPDIRMHQVVLPELLAVLADATIGVAAPLVVNSRGEVEDSARLFPSPLKILRKALGRRSKPDYVITAELLAPEWVGGMFMVFRHAVYRQIGGFDEKYFLYYEDVDLCARLWLRKLQVVLVPQARVVHDAQRSSHRKLQYLQHHLGSMLQFFLSPVYWRARYLRKTLSKNSRTYPGRTG